MRAIEIDNVSFSYDGARQALDDVTLAVEEGEFVCVIGSNGSGKSTLARLMNGLATPDVGEVRVFGASTADAKRVFEVRSSVGMVFQDPDDQIVASIVEDDIAFGPENLGIEPAAIRERVTRALARVGLAGFEKRTIDTLSGGQKQRVAIAGALAMEPRVLVFDEASAMLDPHGRAELMDVCRQLNAEGVAIVFITHYMDEAACAARVVALDAGRVVADGPAGEVLARSADLRALGLDAPFAVCMGEKLCERGMPVEVSVDEAALVAQVRELCGDAIGKAPQEVGRLQGDSLQGLQGDLRVEFAAPNATPSVVSDASANAVAGAAAIEFDAVTFSYESQTRGGRAKKASGRHPAAFALKDVTFRVASGEMLGIAGRTGSGKSTLVQLSGGLLEPTGGSVSVCGQRLDSRKARQLARREIGVVFQYPEHQLFAATVFEDAAFGPRNLELSEDVVEQRVKAALADVGLDVADVGGESPFALSGGQQRRVAIAGVLAMEPRVLVFDEPLAGLDPRSRRAFIDLIGNLHAHEGRTVIVVSHDMDALAELCDRIAVLEAGTVRALGAPVDVFGDGEGIRAAGLDVPATMRFARALGVGNAFSHVPSVDDLAEFIGQAFEEAARQTHLDTA